MENSFWFGYKFDSLIFPGFRVSSYAEFTAACVFLIAMTLFYQMLKIVELKAKFKAEISLQRISEGGNDTNQLLNNFSTRSSLRLLWLETVIYLLELSVGYIIMLIVMTYNVYFFIIAVGTSALIYFFMGQLIIRIKFEMAKLKKPSSGDNLSFTNEDTSGEAPSSSQPPDTVYI